MFYVCSLYYIFKELEKELDLQTAMKTEMEIAMKLLEKDTHEKQDTLVALRQQLEEVKAINLQMFNKSQVFKSFFAMATNSPKIQELKCTICLIKLDAMFTIIFEAENVQNLFCLNPSFLPLLILT